MVDAPAPRNPRARRVARACDYCRKKRLKCTPNQRPCLNCQLYDAECTSHDRGRRTATQHVRRGEKPVTDRGDQATADSVNGNRASAAHPQTGDSSVGLTIGPSVDASCTADTTSPVPWLQGDGFIEDEPNSHEFENVLRQLGIGVSASSWGPNKEMPGDIPVVDAGFMDTNPEASRFTLTRALEDCPPNDNHCLQDPRPIGSGSGTSSVNGRVSSIGSLRARDANTLPMLQPSVPPGVFIRENETVAHYIGSSSVGATLALCLKDGLESQLLPLNSSSLGFLIEAAPHVDKAGLNPLLDLSSLELPPRDASMRSVDAYFRNLNVFYPIAQEDSFRERFESLYTSNRSSLTIFDYCLFYLVVSIGALSQKHTSQNSGALDELATTTYRRAWSMMQDSIATPCEASLQILLLHVARYVYFGKSGIAWVYCRLAVSIAQSLGLHRETPSDIDLPECQLRLRSRLWWIVLSFDSSLSLSQGRPPGIMDTAYDSQVLPDLAVESDSSSSPSLAEIYIWMYRLSQIQNRFCNLMHSNNTALDRLEGIVQINESLTAWRERLPVACRPDMLILVSPDKYSHILLTHLEYFNLMRTIHWAALTLSAVVGDSEGLSSCIRASEAFCVEAARLFIKRLNDMGDMQLWKVFVISFQINNCMAAIATLYRWILRNPQNLSTRADLEHLRAGKIHLDRDTPESFAIPGLKALFENMLQSAQEVVWKNESPQAH